MANEPGSNYAVADIQYGNLPAPSSLSEERWLYPSTISGGNWNRVFPYQLMVVERQDDSTYTLLKSDTPGTSWQFTLPIPPDAMTISTPFAINTTVTLGGYIEEHNGIPIRMITMSGTTGIFPGRTPAPARPDFSGLLGSPRAIFAGTISSAGRTAASFDTLVSGRNYPRNAVPQSSFDQVTEAAPLTGYYQFRLLQLFFEAYAELKRTNNEKSRRYRLALGIWKQEEVYLVTPIQFDVPRSAQSPLEYRYNLSFKASKRIQISPGRADIVSSYIPVQRDPNKLAQLLMKIQDIRVVVQNARNTITAVVGDIGYINASLFEPLRELTMLGKDALSVPLAVADLSDALIQETRMPIILARATQATLVGVRRDIHQATLDTMRNVAALTSELIDDSMAPASRILGRNAHPANDPYLHPKDNYEFFSNIRVGDLHLAASTVAKIAAERTRVRQLTRLDYEKRRDAVVALAAHFSNAIGIGSDTYNEVYGIDAPTVTRITNPSDGDYEAAYAMNSLIVEMNRLVVTNDVDPNPKLDSIAVVAGLAAQSGIAFRTPVSKFAVPFPYGCTLEVLAARHLGDPGRWYEIATLNGLQTPYVDEEGFTLPLLVSGAGRTVIVSDRSNIFVGQTVWVESIGTTRNMRHITGIDVLSPTQVLVTLDGDADLEKYTVASGAFLQAFLPNTLNSQMVVYIPSNRASKEEDFKTKTIPDIDEHDRMLSVGGIDLLLTLKNDLVITPNGDVRWSVGLTNIVQKIRIAMSVRQGTLLEHPQFGLPLAPGESIADTSAANILRAAQDLFRGDPSFVGVKGARVDINGPLARLGLAVEIAGFSQIIPVSAEVAR